MTETKILKDSAVDLLRSRGLIEPLTPHALASLRMWECPEHRAKVLATNAKRRADPIALAAMRERLDRNRMPRSEISEKIALAWFRKCGWGGFASNTELAEWITTQYRLGASARQIALALGMAHTAVVRRLRLSGIELPPRGTGRHQRKTSETHLKKFGITDMPSFDAEVAALYRDNYSVGAIAKGYGMTDQMIRTSIFRSGVPLRGKGGRPSKQAEFRIDTDPRRRCDPQRLHPAEPRRQSSRRHL